MGWLRVDLRGKRDPLPHDAGSARARRLELRRRLTAQLGLTGAAALEITRQMRVLELREAAESLQELH